MFYLCFHFHGFLLIKRFLKDILFLTIIKVKYILNFFYRGQYNRPKIRILIQEDILECRKPSINHKIDHGYHYKYISEVLIG